MPNASPPAPAPRAGSAALSPLVALAAIVVVIAGMKAGKALIVPFLLSAFIAVISAPPLFWLERKGLARWLAMLIVLLVVMLVLGGLSTIVGTSIHDFTKQLPEYQVRLNSQFNTFLDWLEAWGPADARQALKSYIDPGKAIRILGDTFNGLGAVLADTFLITLTVVFILFETSSFPRKLRAIVADPEHSLRQFDQFNQNLKRYLVIKGLASLGTGLAVWLMLSALGVDFPVLWALLAFLLNFVPNIGSIIAAVPGVLFALVQLGPGAALWAALGYGTINTVVGSIIEPRFLGRELGMSTLVVFLSLVFWGWVLGPVGMFLSVPLTMTVKIALDSRESTHWISVLLGPEAAATEEAERHAVARAREAVPADSAPGPRQGHEAARSAAESPRPPSSGDST